MLNICIKLIAFPIGSVLYVINFYHEFDVFSALTTFTYVVSCCLQKRVTRVGDIINPPTSQAHNLSPQTHWGNVCPTVGFCRNHSCIDIRTGFLPWSVENRIELHAVISPANVCFPLESRIANTPDRFRCERIQSFLHGRW